MHVPTHAHAHTHTHPSAHFHTTLHNTAAYSSTARRSVLGSAPALVGGSRSNRWCSSNTSTPKRQPLLASPPPASRNNRQRRRRFGTRQSELQTKRVRKEGSPRELPPRPSPLRSTGGGHAGSATPSTVGELIEVARDGDDDHHRVEPYPEPRRLPPGPPNLEEDDQDGNEHECKDPDTFPPGQALRNIDIDAADAAREKDGGRLLLPSEPDSQQAVVVGDEFPKA
eukprot:CAMPEP_0114125102 /NCGR_PEP_ID=MMETSP0043_2-20121206/9124_1 /TAXON_ID=464988 /ORGANISM="Hemiselmis andersenii, Strain CCMP644" /LENGTH=225 /DNA_ID=CAMNT_0001218011 /DNA_START=68 /DNA_END=742 /DNA_ORIENTATION=-